MLRRFAALLAVALCTSSIAPAQSCPPGTICSSGATCPGLGCAPGATLHSRIVSVSTPPLLPPQQNLSLLVPRFVPGPGQTLVRAQVDLAAEIVGGTIQARNLSPTPAFAQTFVLSTHASFVSNFVPLYFPGVVVTPASFSFTTNLPATTWPGPPANPCDFSGIDAVTYPNLNTFDGRRICIDDPAVLAGQFTSSSAASTVDFLWETSDTSLHAGAGNLCILFVNPTRLSATITYFYCDSNGGAGLATCPGDGTQTPPCPCNNEGLFGRGCANSVVALGASLSASGDPAADSIVFHGGGLPPTASSVLLQGSLALASPVTFGDGLRCVGGALKRMYAGSAQGGALDLPGPGDASVRARSAQLGDLIPPGSTRHYQVWYRDPDPLFCPAPGGSTFNSTNAWQLVWP